MEIDMNSTLAALDEAHNPEGVEDGFSSLPDGAYHCRLDKLYISKSKKDRLQTTFEFDVIDGVFAFRKIKKFAGMEKAEALDFLTRDLRRVGIDNFKWSNVQEKFATALDKLFQIELKTKASTKPEGGSFQSVYIQKELSSDEIMVSNKLKDASKDDVPF